MVKIKNVLGDVKVGRQGEVVYQRRYGEQVRRMVSPKRAIASEAQIKHRQFYRDALSWRKGLSPPNRRYLEGYCIANGVIDGYGIPLAWHRFALRLYLERVHFVVITRPIAGEEGEEQKYEYYDEGCSAQKTIYRDLWMGQVFTPSIAHRITAVKLWIRREGLPGNLVVSIRKVADYRPTGEDLCVGSIDANAVVGTVLWEWHQINLGEGYDLDQDTQYAIVARCPDGDSDNLVAFRYDGSDATYPGGWRVHSTTGGVTWSYLGGSDIAFEEWGREAGVAGEAGLIHVRHPALLTVVQKRGEQTVKGYDTLSSLDDEYLTGQVGLDVEDGDIIKATTLPGISYRYEV